MNLSDQFGGVGGYWIDHYRGLQVIEKRAARQAMFQCVGAMYAVSEFGYANRAERRFTFGDPPGDVFEEARDVEVLPLSLDHDAGIEDYPRWAGSMAYRIPPSLLRRPS